MLDINKLKEAGFEDYMGEYWFLSVRLQHEKKITFDCTVSKKNGKCEVGVMDEELLVPYDYSADTKVAVQVNMYMNWLKNLGLYPVLMKG